MPSRFLNSVFCACEEYGKEYPGNQASIRIDDDSEEGGTDHLDVLEYHSWFEMQPDLGGTECV